ncbi:hypothetical protein [Fibrella arboris]|uniref:hypothetical protein n=1 Tax=Fibrella arboris TaxID=3242486 RepID=UPI003521F916
MKTIKLVAVALLLSGCAYAQTQPGSPTSANSPGLHQRHRDMTPEQRAALKADRKAKFDKMTPDERKAFREAHRAQRQAKLNALPADQRAKIVEKHRTRHMQRKQEKVK